MFPSFALYLAHLLITSVDAEQGIEKPLTEKDEYILLALHNSRRGQAAVENDDGHNATLQGNMECLMLHPLFVQIELLGFLAEPNLFGTAEPNEAVPCFKIGINKTLTNRAQAVANSCGAQLPDNATEGFAVFTRDGTDKIATPYHYMAAAQELLKRYRVPDNAFTQELKQEEENFLRQVYWYQAHEIGCGRSICENKTMIVCAYSYKQVKTSMPFLAHPTRQGPCTHCSSRKRYCDGENLCCEVKMSW